MTDVEKKFNQFICRHVKGLSINKQQDLKKTIPMSLEAIIEWAKACFEEGYQSAWEE